MLLESPEFVIASVIGKRGNTDALDEESDGAPVAQTDAEAVAGPALGDQTTRQRFSHPAAGAFAKH